MATASLDIAKRNPHAAPVAVSDASRLDGIEKVAELSLRPRVAAGRLSSGSPARS